MAAFRRALFLPLVFSLAAASAQGPNNPPVLDEPIQANRVAPTIPGGRALLFPLTASDPDGDRLIYTVRSSNPRILARVKTGNPFLKFTVNHADGGASDPGYSGDLVFMLLRDWTPITSAFIAGFAQSGFYDGTDEVPVTPTVFHRITSLGGGSTGFIFQGGDPLGTGLGGPGMTGNDPATSWKFDNELDPGLIFVGRGQLAMANSGTNAQVFGGSVFGDFRDSNGSQFFITDGQPRHLDFRHTIFAQLVRGWELLPQIRGTLTTNSEPDADVTLTATSVQPTSGANQTDAVLVLTATGQVSSTITVTVDDQRGLTATKTFTVEGVKETSNTPPFVRKVAPQVTPRDVPAIFPVEVIDLEHDFTTVSHSRITVDAVNSAQRSTFVVSNGQTINSGPTAALRPNAGYVGPLHMGFIADQFDVGDQAFAQSGLATGAAIGVGERIAVGERITIEGEPGVPFTGVAGKIRDFDPASGPADFTAKINWGDGSPLTDGTVGRDSANPGATLLTVSGAHTYVKAGIYPVVVNFTGTNGVVGVARGQAIISAAAIRAAGENLEVTGSIVRNRVIATFSDTASTGTPGDYTAAVDWGDGKWTTGLVAKGAGGRFIVRGTHTYRDSERYAIHVRIRRKTDAPGVNEASAWSSATMNFKTAPHLPPFPKPNLTAAWQSAIGKGVSGVPGPNYRAELSGAFIIINSGNRTMPLCAIRYWISDDTTLDKTVDRQVLTRLQNGASFGPQLTLASFRSGASTGNVGVALALPRGEGGGRKHIITELAYRDPLTDVEAIDKTFASPPIVPAVNVIGATNLRTTESGGTATFQVRLDTLPVIVPISIQSITLPPVAGDVQITTAGTHGLVTGQQVTISGVQNNTPNINGVHTVTLVDTDTFTIPVTVTSAGSGGSVQRPDTVTIPLTSSNTAEGTVSPAQLVFTPANWELPQTVTVTGVDDVPRDGPRTFLIHLNPIVSPDTLYNRFDPPDVTVTNLDNEP